MRRTSTGAKTPSDWRPDGRECSGVGSMSICPQGNDPRSRAGRAISMQQVSAREHGSEEPTGNDNRNDDEEHQQGALVRSEATLISQVSATPRHGSAVPHTEPKCPLSRGRYLTYQEWKSAGAALFPN